MLLQGILLGLSLSFLIGPLLFAIIEAGIGQGFRAGVSVAAGIWASDFIYVLVVFFGIDALEAVVALPHFKIWAGILGSILLLAFGVGSIWKVRSGKSRMAGETQEHTRIQPLNKNYKWWWLRGFLLNTINPGTLFFWLGITTAVVVPSGWSRPEMVVFFGGMLATLILTDTLKAWAAKKVRRFLTPTHTQQIQVGIGLLMILFGLVLGTRAILT